MADLKRRLAANVEGPWFVDETCINCDACRQYAPDVFAEVGDYSVVQHQPQTADQIWRAELALLACPVGSIGAKGHKISARDDFPLEIEDGIGARGHQDLTAILESLVVAEGQVARVDSGPHGSVEHENSVPERVKQGARHEIL